MPTSTDAPDRAGTQLRRMGAGVLLALLAVVAAACSSGGNDSSSGTTTTTTGGVSTTTSGKATTTTQGTLVPQTPTESEFYSPTKNISCEIDNNFGTNDLTQTLCLTLSPARSVVLKNDGTLTVCTGQTCLSNAGVNTPVLKYGQSITLGGVTCRSASSGMTCTMANGDGFQISSSGVLPKGGSTITST